jgi:tRNA threonylcarbamoyladenosine biosynthesis protein TsaE
MAAPADPPPPPPTRVLSDGPERTEALGAELARTLQAGDVVLLFGEVGAGKTTFVRGAARALGHAGRVTSPTFTIVNRYEDGRLPISHLDLYRLAETGGLDAEDPALLADELAPDRVAFVEWPEAAGHTALGPIAARVTLRHAGGDAREIELEARPEGSRPGRDIAQGLDPTGKSA